MNAEEDSQKSEDTGPPTVLLGEWNGLLPENLQNPKWDRVFGLEFYQLIHCSFIPKILTLNL